MHKYAELMNDMEFRLESGVIGPGQKLPSIRELSQSFRCSKSTVIRAYADLEKRHLIYSIPQSGYYAVQRQPGGGERQGQTMKDFASAAPDPNVFPYLDFQHCINKAIDIYKNALFEYGTPQGLPSLLKVLSKHLANYQVFTRPDDIFITSGVQQALSVLASMPFPNGKQTVLVEQPSYYLFIRLLESRGIPAMGLKRTKDGIDLDMLEHLFRTQDIKFFYTTPRFHNPLGTSYSEAIKKSIAYLAQKYDVYIAEDDYLADLETDSKSDPIYVHQSSHVIYLKSYSKILFPGLRVGAAVVPPGLAETFSWNKRLSDIDSSMLSQAALEIYIQSGMFERRKQSIRDSYFRRLERMNHALDAHNDTDCIVHARVHAGVHTHLMLPDRFPLSRLLERMKKKHISLETRTPYYLAGFERMNLLKLSVSTVEEEDIEPGILLIFEEIKRMLHGKEMRSI